MEGIETEHGESEHSHSIATAIQVQKLKSKPNIEANKLVLDKAIVKV